MAKGKEAGSAFLTGLKAKLQGQPEALAHLEALLTVDPFVVGIGDGVAGQSEIDRQLQELRTRATELDTRAQDLTQREDGLKRWHGELTGWREANVELVEIGSAAKKAGWKPGDPPKKTAEGTPVIPEGVVTKDQHDEYVRNTEAAFLGFQAESNALMREHFGTFNEILDILPLLKHPQVRELGLRGVYGLIHKEALDKKQTETAAAREEAIRKDEREKVLAQQATQMPYPLAGSVGADSSPLTAIGKAPGAALVEEAASHYQRLQQGRPS